MINQFIQILKNQGPRYVAFRAMYEAKRKTGLLKRAFPTNPKVKEYITHKDWKALKISFLTGSRNEIKIPKRPNDKLEENFNNIKAGKIRYFNREWKEVNDWLVNPDSNYHYDISNHWTEIEDITSTQGDIKFVWEKSRFSYLYDIIRYDYHFDKDNSDFVFNEIEDWLSANPLNMGPNYKCSQETSLRCLNWIFALYFYQDSEHINEARWQKIMHSIHWQIKHVYSNIDFSRICVRNNHAITESMMIYFGGLLFPFLKEAPKWKKEGKKWLEEEIAYQVYEDGTFLQFSHNYQRVLVQLFTWTIALSEIHKEKLSEVTINKATSVVEYMYKCCVGKEGQLPNYGSNDGALFFRFNDLDYSDFRPQINALYNAMTLKHLYIDEKIQEDSFWTCQNLTKDFELNIVFNEEPLQVFSQGGIYTIEDKRDKTFTFYKCTDYKDRPAHADNMHLDIWVNGINYLRDSGTYKYNTSESNIDYFAGTKGHNSLLVNGENQMTKGPRFLWFDWTRFSKVNCVEEKVKFVINSEAKMFPRIENGGIMHKRKVEKIKHKPIWIITDEVDEKINDLELTQIWHPHPDYLGNIIIEAKDSGGEILSKQEAKGQWSEYYGQKIDVPMWNFNSKSNRIITKIEIRN